MHSLRRASVLALVVWSSSVPSLAYLGGFEAGDGYQGPAVGYTINQMLLDQYNAGQFGLNASGPGGAYTPIVPGSGLYQELAPTSNGYAVASTDGAHSGVWSLDLRGGTGAGFSPRVGNGLVDLEYRYRLDTRDFGGVSPTAGFNNTLVTVSFYYCGGVGFTGDDPGVFRMEFQDQFGLTGAGFGLDELSALTTYDATGWNSSGQSVGPGFSYPWTYVRVTLDLANDVFSVGITPNIAAGVFIPDATPTMVQLLSNAPMAANLANLAQFEFWVDSEVGAVGNTGVFGSNKQLLDDFRFSSRPVPEASRSPGLFLAGWGMWIALRRWSACRKSSAGSN